MTEGIFTSVLVYCLPVFGGCDKHELEPLQIMQNKAARLVTRQPLSNKDQKKVTIALYSKSVSLL